MVKRNNLSKRRSNLSKRRSYKRRSNLSKRRSYKRKRTQKRRNNIKRLRIKGGSAEEEDKRVLGKLNKYNDVPFNYEDLSSETKKEVAAVVDLQVPADIVELCKKMLVWKCKLFLTSLFFGF